MRMRGMENTILLIFKHFTMAVVLPPLLLSSRLQPLLRRAHAAGADLDPPTPGCEDVESAPAVLAAAWAGARELLEEPSPRFVRSGLWDTTGGSVVLQGGQSVAAGCCAPSTSACSLHQGTSMAAEQAYKQREAAVAAVRGVVQPMSGVGGISCATASQLMLAASLQPAGLFLDHFLSIPSPATSCTAPQSTSQMPCSGPACWPCRVHLRG